MVFMAGDKYINQAIKNHFASGETVAPSFEEVMGEARYLEQQKWKESPDDFGGDYEPLEYSPPDDWPN